MNIKLKELNLIFKKSTEIIDFKKISYFYGQMGAGKSSIARLLDFCLGGDLELSPALQNEFNVAILKLTINNNDVILERVRDNNLIRTSFNYFGETFDLLIPARIAAGVVLPNTEVENLSDLLFYLSGIKPPKVRRSKRKEESELTRLSIRDLLWYCYLDQDNMDSNFFHLDSEANNFKRLKSRDVLRYIIGFHQENVAELETQLQEVHDNRFRLITGAESLKQALEETNIESENEIRNHIDLLENELKIINDEIIKIRHNTRIIKTHPVDEFKEKARNISSEIESIDDAISIIKKTVLDDQRHINELKMLSVKLHRASEARAIIGGVDFDVCPRCAQNLPKRPENHCIVCGQEERELENESIEKEVIEKDASLRIAELEEAISRHKVQLKAMLRRQTELTTEKRQIDKKISDLMQNYDSEYLSSALEFERRRAELQQQIIDLNQFLNLTKRVNEQLQLAENLEIKEIKIRQELKQAREAAEEDTRNLKRLEQLFLDCLIRSRVPGINREDTVSIKSPAFLPEVTSPEAGDLAVTSFANLSSGGKKVLFKCCFGIAMHRLAVEANANLPRFLIIDSPMKNISERENVEQFEGFYRMLYELMHDELSEMQLLIIDNEYLAPPDNFPIEMKVRHMKPNQRDALETEFPPLIPYYMGH